MGCEPPEAPPNRRRRGAASAEPLTRRRAAGEARQVPPNRPRRRWTAPAGEASPVGGCFVAARHGFGGDSEALWRLLGGSSAAPRRLAGCSATRRRHVFCSAAARPCLCWLGSGNSAAARGRAPSGPMGCSVSTGCGDPPGARGKAGCIVGAPLGRGTARAPLVPPGPREAHLRGPRAGARAPGRRRRGAEALQPLAGRRRADGRGDRPRRHAARARLSSRRCCAWGGGGRRRIVSAATKDRRRSGMVRCTPAHGTEPSRRPEHKPHLHQHRLAPRCAGGSRRPRRLPAPRHPRPARRLHLCAGCTARGPVSEVRGDACMSTGCP